MTQILENEYDIDEIILTDEQISELADGNAVVINERQFAITISPERDGEPEVYPSLDALVDSLFDEDLIYDVEPFEGGGAFWDLHPSAVETVKATLDSLGYTVTVDKPAAGANTNDTGKRYIEFEEGH